MKQIGIPMQMTNVHGWGIYAYQLVARLLETQAAFPVLLTLENPRLGEPELARVKPAIDYFQSTTREQFSSLRAGGGAAFANCPVLHGLNNNFTCGSGVKGPDRDYATVFFEHTQFSPERVAFAKSMRRIITGSQWNTDVVRSLGIDTVELCHQGIDTRIFFPGPRSDLYPKDRFVVFSGGQFHLRKGQDIALAAFRRFRERHPDALLVFAWHSHWPAFARTMLKSPHLAGWPMQGDEIDFDALMGLHGIPPEGYINLGLNPHHRFGAIFRGVDAAVFPNRCEGGTNLVAMEALASGVPCVVAANTGQIDLVQVADTFVLEHQPPVAADLLPDGVDGWGESSVEELVERLEEIYTSPDAARAKGARSAKVMASWTWARQADRIIRALDLP